MNLADLRAVFLIIRRGLRQSQQMAIREGADLLGCQAYSGPCLGRSHLRCFSLHRSQRFGSQRFGADWRLTRGAERLGPDRGRCAPFDWTSEAPVGLSIADILELEMYQFEYL